MYYIPVCFMHGAASSIYSDIGTPSIVVQPALAAVEANGQRKVSSYKEYIYCKATRALACKLRSHVHGRPALLTYVCPGIRFF